MTARISVDVTCPRCGGPVDHHHNDPADTPSVRRAVVHCPRCNGYHRLTVTLCAVPAQLRPDYTGPTYKPRAKPAPAEPMEAK